MVKRIIIFLGLLSLTLPAWARNWEDYFEYKIKMPLNKKKVTGNKLLQKIGKHKIRRDKECKSLFFANFSKNE